MTGSLQIKKLKKGEFYYTNINIYNEKGERKPKWEPTNLLVSKSNEKKAYKILQDRINKYESISRYGQDINILFCDYIVYWLDKKKNKIDSVTYSTYLSNCEKHIIPYFKSNKIKLLDLKRKDIQAYLDYKSCKGRLDNKGGLSAATIQKHKNIISDCLNYAVMEEIIPVNFCDSNIQIPKIERRKPSYLTKEQIDFLLSNIRDDDFYYIIKITYLLALRKSELQGLTWDDIDFVNNTLSINNTLVKDTLNNVHFKENKTKSKTSNRSFPLNDETKQLFLEIKDRQEYYKSFFGKGYYKSNFVFVDKLGKPYSPDYITKKFQKLLKKYNLPIVRFHDLRESCASYLANSGVSIQEISNYLGHSDIKVTIEHYAYIYPNSKVNIVNDISNSLSN